LQIGANLRWQKLPVEPFAGFNANLLAARTAQRECAYANHCQRSAPAEVAGSFVHGPTFSVFVKTYDML
jgi:hypothetical protein